MKSYSLSLADYLASYRESLSPRTSLVLLTQLLEGVAFLTSSGVAHRYEDIVLYTLLYITQVRGYSLQGLPYQYSG